MRVLTKGARVVELFDNWTQRHFELYNAFCSRKARLAFNPVVQVPLRPQILYPQAYNSNTALWATQEEVKSTRNSLLPGSVLKLVSWNVHWNMLSPERRMTTAIDHLQERFRSEPGSLLIMLQEVRKESLDTILENSWVQGNFVLSDTTPPQSVPDDVYGKGFVLKRLHWRATPYFTLMLVPRSLKIVNSFRVPLNSLMGRDALFVDVAKESTRSKAPQKMHRLCTAHLESLGAIRSQADQLATIASLLKGDVSQQSDIVAGVFGGDTNSNSSTAHNLHKTPEVGMVDVWEDETAPAIPRLKPFVKDLTLGRERGYTWGYQTEGAKSRKRLDKFLYTGRLETVALSEPQDVAGKIDRLGIGCKTEVEGWLREERYKTFVRGKLVDRTKNHYYPDAPAEKLDKGRKDVRRVKMDHWVSDHFGIAVGIKIKE